MSGALGVSRPISVPSLAQFGDVGLRPGGLLFPVPLAFEPPDAATIVRAALESFAFAIRLILDRIRELTGPVETVSVGGGLTRSTTFLDVLSNVVEPPLYVSESPEVSLLGTITLAAAAVELGPGLEAGLLARRGELRQLQPSPASVEEYKISVRTRGCRGSNDCWNSNSRINAVPAARWTKPAGVLRYPIAGPH